MKSPGSQLTVDDYQLPEVEVRLYLQEKQSLYSAAPLTDPQAAAGIMKEIMHDLDREMLCVVNLDNFLKPINYHVVSIGSINMSVAPIPNLFKSALLSNSAAILMIHNHPSGNILPSSQDYEITKKAILAAQLMEIPLIDHLIVGTDTETAYSFRESNPGLFELRGISLPWEKVPGQQEAIAEPAQAYQTALAAGRKLPYLEGGDQMPETEDRTIQAPFQEDMGKNEAQERVDKVKEITDRLEAGIRDLFYSEKYTAWLTTMSRFHNYSLNNTLLITMQRPDATRIAGYTAWQQHFGRHVRKGEKAIRILAPTPYKKTVEVARIDPASNKPILNGQGEPVTEKKEVTRTGFKVSSVFDISQTEGKELPQLGIPELTGEVKDYLLLYEALKRTCPVPVEFDQILGNAKGYFSPVEDRIILQTGMSQQQTIKTLIHEMAHQKLHGLTQDEHSEGAIPKSRNTREVEAESVAYTVCQHFGIDTSDYSFGYIAGWSQGKEMPELKSSLNTIRRSASELIGDVEEHVQSILKERGTPEKAEIRDKEEVPEITEQAGDARRPESRSVLADLTRKQAGTDQAGQAVPASKKKEEMER